MAFTLEQARALDAVARHGTFARAAASLGKRHTAVVYAIAGLERVTGLVVLDRSKNPSTLTAEGERLLALARRVLDAERELLAASAEMRTGWEADLKVVIDGIFPVTPILHAVRALAAAGATTRISVTTEFLDGVERAFYDEGADVMIAVLPPERTLGLRVVRLPPIRTRLVAHRQHPLARAAALETSDLSAHTLLTVRGSGPKLVLPTSVITKGASVRLNDFHAKKAAIMACLGYGWMPEHLVGKELRSRQLEVLAWGPALRGHLFEPRLYYRGTGKLGRASRFLVDAMKSATYD